MRANDGSMFLRAVALLLLLGPVGVSTAAGQEPGDESLRSALRPGRTIWVTDRTGTEEQARVIGLSGEVLATTTGEQVRRLRIADVTRIRARESDRLLNGAVIGAGAALASGLLLCSLTEPWANCRDDVGPLLRIGGLGAAAGVAIDALVRGRTTIYEASPGSLRLDLAPTVTRRAGALHLRLVF